MAKHNGRHRIGAALLALVMLIGMFPAANASLALGWELIDNPVRLADGVTLTTGKLWSDSKQDLRTEYYIDYTPGAAVKPMVYYGEHVANWDPLTVSAAAVAERGYRVVAGINGGFFNTNGTAVGIVYSDGEMKAMDAYNAYLLGFKRDGSAFVDNSVLTLQASWQVGDYTFTKKMAGMNCYRLNEGGHASGGLYLYSPDYYDRVRENTATHSISVVVKPIVAEALLSMNSTLGMVVVSDPVDSRDEEQTYVAEIPEGCYMLYTNCVDETVMANMLALKEGDTVSVSLSGGSADWTDAVCGLTALYMLVENGAVAEGVDKLTERFNPYTAVGIKPDGSIVFYAIDGRRPGHSVGAQYRQVAERLIELGCTTAVALDGGGSTTVGSTVPSSETFTLDNTPSDGKERYVSTCIFLVADPDTPTLSAPGYHIEAESQVVYVGATAHFKAYPYDTYGRNDPTMAEPTWGADGGSIAWYIPEPSPEPAPEESENPDATEPVEGTDPEASAEPAEDTAGTETMARPMSAEGNSGDNPEVSESMEPAENTDPTESTEPAESEEPSESTDPVENTEPSESAEPTESTEPGESEAPTESEEPSESEAPTESEEPSESEAPTESEEPSESEAPTESAKPSESEAPTASPEPSEAPEPKYYEAVYTAGKEPGDYHVTASGSSIPVKVVDSLTGLSMRREDGLPLQSSLKVSAGEVMDFTLRPMWKGIVVAMDDVDAQWTADAAVGTIDANGCFTAAGGNTEGDITVSVGGQTVTIHVQVDRGDPFMDVDKDHWASEYITEIYQAGMASGIQEADGSFTFHPNDKMSRLELLVMISHMLGEDTSRYADVELPFVDADQVPAWAMADVKAMYALGVIGGSLRGDGLYLDPTASVTREMAMTMMGKVLVSETAADLSNFTDGDTVSDWAKPFVENMVALGVINGAYGMLSPAGGLTRAEGAAMIVRSAVLERNQLSLIPELQEKDPDPTTVGDDPATPGAEETEPAEPGTDETEPGTEPTEPGTDETDPGTEPEEPGTEDTDPSAESNEPGTEDTEPGTDDADSGGDPAAPGTEGTAPGDGETEGTAEPEA